MSRNYTTLESLTDLPAPSVIMMAGVPASGKSTVADQLGELLSFPIFSSDGIREEITGSQGDISQDQKVWDTLYARAEEYLEGNRSFIVDATHNNQRGRERDVGRYREWGARIVVCVSVIAELDTILARNSTRDRFVPEDVIERMSQNLASNPPSVNDGFDSVIRLTN